MTTQIDRWIDLAIFRIDVGAERHQRVAVSGNRQHPVRSSIVDYAIRVGNGSDATEYGVALEIEDEDRAGAAAVGDESATEPGNIATPCDLI